MYVVKRKGHVEKFDERKIYASCYAACMTCGLHENGCEIIASNVSKEIKKWVRKRKRVTSKEISRKVISQLRKVHKPAAFMYETHLDVS
ncbi:MAG: hypothetical protein HYT71_03895 [Candidatus Aenigmarchaeota archaeon]|nr:hypothetical protein [Candidatus Aenigmarchaeota archaeon]